MNKSTVISLLILFLIIGTINLPVLATSYTILDKYWGAADRNYGDIIGSAGNFDISKMIVTYQAGKLSQVDIYSRYFDNIGLWDTQLGDLFISTDGWHPKGTAPYKYDNFNNPGEKWEYGLVLDNHLSSTGGGFSLYGITDSDIKLSFAKPGYVFRDGQEVQIKTDYATLIASGGTWSLNNIGGSTDMDDFLRFDLTTLGTHSYTGFPGAFHWGPTCANDVIEGIVPEPSTLLLLGSGLLGLGIFSKYRRRKQD